MKVKQKVLLIILDGLGAAPKNQGNAVTLANPQNLSTLWNIYPHTYLLASGEAVGLPKNVRGNSEVGHLNLGAGNVVAQTFPRINNAIQKGLLLNNDALKGALAHALRNNSDIHLMGLLSDGSVHSHIDHFKAVLDFFAKANFEGNIYIHAFTDGRDTPTNNALQYLTDIDKYCLDRGIGKIGTIVGRYFAMDRNNQWDRTERAYYLLTRNIGEKFTSYGQAIDTYYSKGVTDEFMEPIVVNDSKIKTNDAVIMLNFRPDRALQLSQAFADPNFSAFKHDPIQNLYFAGMVEYSKGFPTVVLFPKQYVNLPLGKVIDSVGLRQLRIAETEKFPHVTYFFNGGASVIYANEDQIAIPSPQVATYDLKPEMSALEILNVLGQRISSKAYDFILVNFANADMVGHSGVLNAGVKAVQTVDYCVHELVNLFLSQGGAVIITADHGNVEEMINLENGSVDTEHSLNPVPCIIAGTNITNRFLPYGSLKDIAPTILDIMGVIKPTEMNGQSLVRTT